MLPRDCFHNFEQLCRPHTRDVSFVLLERIEFSFFPSEDDDWRFAPENIPPGLDVNGCNLDQKHSCQKVSTKIYRGVGRLRESCLFVLFACQWISSRSGGILPSPSTSLCVNKRAFIQRARIIRSENHDRGRKSGGIIDRRRPHLVIKELVY